MTSTAASRPPVASPGNRGYPGRSPEGSELLDDGRSRSSNLEDALSHRPTPTPNRNHPLPPATVALGFELPEQLLETIAVRVAELLAPAAAAPASPWLDLDAACAYLGFSHDTLYKLTAARAIPCRKKRGGQGLRFHRDELDAWMEAAYPRLDRLG